MKVVQRDPRELKPYEQNPRLNDAAVDSVVASIREFGFRQPIVVDEEDVIVVGHTRWKAALELGLDRVPVHVAVGLSPEKIRAYRIADNQTATIADWDLDLLPLELAGLESDGFDLALLGFTADELTKLVQREPVEGATDPDDVPEPPEEATTQPGDLWVLGEHRLLCGDSSDPEQVDRLLDGADIHLVHTDPPYNVKVEPRSNNAIAAGQSSFEGKGRATSARLRAKDRPIANDDSSAEEYGGRLDGWFANLARVLLPGRGFYIWGGYANLESYPLALSRNGLYFSQAIVWDKKHPVLSRKDFMGCFELAFYGWREGAAHQYFGPNNALDLWHVKKVAQQRMVHLTEKPVELAERAIGYSSRPGEHVLDLFGGSGSTLMGCERTGRRGFLMELDPLYCDVIVDRWQRHTQRTAERRESELRA